MNDDKQNINRSVKIGEYISDKKIIEEALAKQRELEAKGVDKRIGEILVESGKISSDILDKIINNQRFDRLRRCPVLSGLTDDELGNMCKYVEEFTVESGEIFISQGTASDALYILVDGHATVFIKGENAEEKSVAEIDSGACIGEMGYFSKSNRTASIRAAEKSQLLKIDYDKLDIIFDIVPALTKNFLLLISQRTGKPVQTLQELKSLYL